MIRIEFPANRSDIALAIGQALTQIGRSDIQLNAPDPAPKPEPSGPFHWVHPKSEAWGVVNSWAEMEGLTRGDPCVEHVSKEAHDAFAARCNEADEAAGGADSATEPEPEPESSDGAAVDEKGVAFNPSYCSQAASPFYGSGKKKGQWKKRQGVDEAKYDDWYDMALADLKFGDKVEHEDAQGGEFDAGAAFGNTGAAQTDDKAPQNCGELMAWISEQQAAGRVTQVQVTEAYPALGLSFDAIMNPAHPIAENCAKIYHHLKGGA